MAAKVTEKYSFIHTRLFRHLVAGFQDEINHFVCVCTGEKETLSPACDGVEMMKIVCGIYESAEKGVEIRF